MPEILLVRSVEVLRDDGFVAGFYVVRLWGEFFRGLYPVDFDDMVLVGKHSRGLVAPGGRLVVVLTVDKPPGSPFGGLH